jgi:hypothetical protein
MRPEARGKTPTFKHQLPSTKFQTNFKDQIPNPKQQPKASSFLSLELGILDLFGIWSLDLEFPG